MMRELCKTNLIQRFCRKKAPEQIPLGDAAKMSAQLNMRIEPFTWVKEILAERHELVLEKDGVISQQSYSKINFSCRC